MLGSVLRSQLALLVSLDFDLLTGTAPDTTPRRASRGARSPASRRPGSFEELVFRQSRVLAARAARCASARRCTPRAPGPWNRRTGRSAFQVCGAEARVHSRIVEKAAAIARVQHLRDRLRAVAGMSCMRPTAPAWDLAFASNTLSWRTRPRSTAASSVELLGSLGQESALFDRIVETAPGVGDPALLGRPDLGHRPLDGRGRGHEASEREIRLGQRRSRPREGRSILASAAASSNIRRRRARRRGRTPPSPSTGPRAPLVRLGPAA